MTREGASIRSDAAGRPLEGRSRSRGRRLLRFAPCALLIGVACHQILLAHTAGLAAWSGGGFGMFASTDAGGTRHLHVFARRPGIRRELQSPRSADDLVRRTLTLPSDANLRRLADTVATLPSPDHGPPTAVEIQIWHTRFDPETLAPEGRILREIEVSFGSE